ncbi:MAG: class I SAM-dependent methyltransferase [Candidatus Poseidoniaceae archaeon]
MGWYQKEHAVTNELLSLCKGKRIIDVGAGATTLVKSLIDREYEVTVLDISSKALEILSSRHGDHVAYKLGDLSSKLKLDEYDIWHDRAVLHFLVEEEEYISYVSNLESCIPIGGFAVIETFSLDGAEMCCGLNLRRYSEDMLVELLGRDWQLLRSINHVYTNPNGGERPYISAVFQRK